VTIVWLVLGAGMSALPSPAGTTTSQRDPGCCRVLRSNETRSLKKTVSTCPPNTYNFDPTILSVCPYLPDGRWPCGVARDHCRVAVTKLAKLPKCSSLWYKLTSVQQIQGLVQYVSLIALCVSSKHYWPLASPMLSGHMRGTTNR
jgi:hypothetical protein